MKVLVARYSQMELTIFPYRLWRLSQNPPLRGKKCDRGIVIPR